MEQTDKFIKAEAKELIKAGIDKELIDKCQKWALEQAMTETDRATYQAMEAFIHNLNTMHSRARRTDPFLLDKLWYGHFAGRADGY